MSASSCPWLKCRTNLRRDALLIPEEEKEEDEEEELEGKDPAALGVAMAAFLSCIDEEDEDDEDDKDDAVAVVHAPPSMYVIPASVDRKAVPKRLMSSPRRM